MSAEHFWHQLFSLESRRRSDWIGWKVRSTGYNIARRLWELREAAARGREPAVGHPPVILWMPYMAHAACLGCTWIDLGDSDVTVAARRARAHSVTAGMPPHEAGRLAVEVIASRSRDWCPPPDLPSFVPPDLSDPLGRISSEREGE
jgi:hypothetical protein